MWRVCFAACDQGSVVVQLRTTLLVKLNIGCQIKRRRLLLRNTPDKMLLVIANGEWDKRFFNTFFTLHGIMSLFSRFCITFTLILQVLCLCGHVKWLTGWPLTWKPGKVWEFKIGQGKVGENRKSQG